MWRVGVLSFIFAAVLTITASAPPRTESKFSDGVLDDAPIVDIPNLGKVQGTRRGVSFLDKRPFAAFLGIRFAKAPSGSRRFQPPELEDPWDDVRPAKFLGRKCPQTGLFRDDQENGDFWRNDPRNWHAALEERLIRENHPILKEMNEDEQATNIEDCLFIHIYTPNENATGLPVMVFFHGGAFAGGSALVYGAQKFMDKDVVLVVPHYRLGPLGFLSLQTDDIPGNAGLLDQVLALKWVNQHISAFGGDPNKVTIFGESAGAASVSYHMLSPLSKGLFSHVIAESGSALSDWAVDLIPEHHTVNIAAIAGCDAKDENGNPDIKGITDCLMAVEAMNLTKSYQIYKGQEEKRGHTGFGGCSPIIQRAGKQKFMEIHPDTVIRSGNYTKVPIMFGSNRDEGTYVLAIVYFGYMVPNNLVENEYFLKYQMSDVALSLFNVKDPNYWLVDALENHYEPEDARGNFIKLMPALIDTLGAAFLKGPTFHVVQFNSQYQDSYHYTFNFNGTKSLWSQIGNTNSPFPGGVCHSNDLLYIFNIPTFNIGESDMAVSKRMVALWTNFATYGNPTPKESPVEGVPEWPKYNKDDKPYMRIMEEFTIQNDFTKEYTISVDEGMIPNPPN